MYLLGYDLGSSSVKCSLVDSESGRIVASDFFPKSEMSISAPRSGWAEQNPEDWWANLVMAHKSVTAGIAADQIEAIGITYQMHGLVLVDKQREVLRPSIIWCDSRAVPYGERAFREIGQERCLSTLLNSPGNFTASKLAWVREHEPRIFERVDKLMLPGDWIALRLTDEVTTTVEGLSEGMFWDFAAGGLSEDVLRYYDIPRGFFPTIVPVFGEQGRVSARAAAELGLREGTPVTYRAGDQPNNALSLGVFEPGEIASTAGTSGVVYGVLDRLAYDPRSRVNTFAHVNHSESQTRLGVLLCINGTGILNSWLRRNVAPELSYAEMNDLAAASPVGARGMSITPFGNGAERVLENADRGCAIHGINFNIHDRSDILRAAQEGIVFSYEYGLEIMRGMGMNTGTIKAGRANMFLSPIFTSTLASVSGSEIELYDTDGAAGAARAAGIGSGRYSGIREAFSSLTRLATIAPDRNPAPYREAYERWRNFVING